MPVLYRWQPSWPAVAPSWVQEPTRLPPTQLVPVVKPLVQSLNQALASPDGKDATSGRSVRVAPDSEQLSAAVVTPVSRSARAPQS